MERKVVVEGGEVWGAGDILHCFTFMYSSAQVNNCQEQARRLVERDKYFGPHQASESVFFIRAEFIKVNPGSSVAAFSSIFPSGP